MKVQKFKQLSRVIFVLLALFYFKSSFASEIISTSASASILGDVNIFDTSTDENKIYFNIGGEYAVEVTESRLTGFAWGDTIGWVSLNCLNTGDGCTAENDSFGVTNDGQGNLSGFAWGENAGWISFSCENNDSCAGNNNAKVTIDPETGVFSGFAWAENFGWISFNCTQMSECGTNEYGVVTEWVSSASGPQGGGVLPVTYLLQQGLEFEVVYDIYEEFFLEESNNAPEIDCSINPELCIGNPDVGSDFDCSLSPSDCVVRPNLCDKYGALCANDVEVLKPEKQLSEKYELIVESVVEKVQEVPNKYSIPAFVGFLLSGLGLLYFRARWLL